MTKACLSPIESQTTDMLQLALRLLKILHMSKLVVVLQAFWVQESTRRLDFAAGNDLLHGKLYLLHIHRGLQGFKICQ